MTSGTGKSAVSRGRAWHPRLRPGDSKAAKSPSVCWKAKSAAQLLKSVVHASGAAVLPLLYQTLWAD